MRWFRWLVGGYLALAIATRLTEIGGMQRCSCNESCWCRSPLLSAFRWVVPFHGPASSRRDDRPLNGSVTQLVDSETLIRPTGRRWDAETE